MDNRRRMLNMELPSREKNKTTERFDGSSEEGHAKGWNGTGSLWDWVKLRQMFHCGNP